MADWDDVVRLASTLPELTERSAGGLREWRVRGKLVAWERPLRRSDLEELGAGAPDGAILAVRVPDLVAKEALVADSGGVCFTTPHFDGYPAVLVRLDGAPLDELWELLVEAWLVQAPRRFARDLLDDLPSRPE